MWSSLSVTCGFPRILRFPAPIKLTTYNWNNVESSVKHHNPNHIPFSQWWSLYNCTTTTDDIHQQPNSQNVYFPSLCFLQCNRDTVSTVHFICYLTCNLVLQGKRSVCSSSIASNVVLIWDIKRLSAWCINLNGVIRCLFQTQSYRSLMFLFDLCQYLKHEYHQTLNSSTKEYHKKKKEICENDMNLALSG